MLVTKRSGIKEPLDISNIRKQTQPACDGLLGTSFEELELAANISFSDGMKTTDINELFVKAALKKTDVDKPNWVYVAARLKLYGLYHEVKYNYLDKKVSGDVYKAITMRDYLKKMKTKTSQGKELVTYLSKVPRFDMDRIEAAIDGKRDLLFNYFGIESIIQRYLLSHKDKVLELPQHMFMSLAMYLAQNEDNPTDWAIKFYDTFSLLEAELGTPSLSNGRRSHGSIYSCFVGSTEDNLESIFDTYKNQALISKNGGGIGWDWTRVRALGGTILDIPGVAGGLIPFMKIENDIAIAVDQLSTRLGAINVSLETWHKDILDFLDLKKPGGEESRRANELFLTCSCSDLFMERVDENAEFTLFDPYDVRDLTEHYGEEFNQRYIGYEERFRSNPNSFANTPVTINAKDLMKKIINYAWDTGIPSLTFKDKVNREHQCPELGIIRSANLCQEILNPVSGDDEMVVCNLASINLSKINTVEEIKRVSYILVRALDNIIDVSTFPVEVAKRTQLDRRAIGVGVCGEAEMIANMHIMYGSDEHLEVIDVVYGALEKYTDEASEELAKLRGPWRPGKKYRNAYRRAIAPTSSIGIIMDTTASHEPAFGKIWAEENAMGIFKVTAPKLTSDNYTYYVSPYEVDPIRYAMTTARRQPRIDMGISHNFYFDPTTTKGVDVYNTIMFAWRAGFKTTYYVRTGTKKLSPEEADGFNANDMIEVKNNDIACFGCGG